MTTSSSSVDNTMSVKSQSSYHGVIVNEFDALIVYEMARRGVIPRVTRRFGPVENPGVIKSGSIFIFDEVESGMKRWTDGLSWSPSRIHGNFLMYRQLSPKEVAKKKEEKALRSLARRGFGSPSSSKSKTPTKEECQRARDKETTMNMLYTGRLTDTPEMRNVIHWPGRGRVVGGGLIKKSISLMVRGYPQHLISYFSVDDILAGRLRQPSSIPELSAWDIFSDTIWNNNWRVVPMTYYGYDGRQRYSNPFDDESENSSPSPITPFGQPFTTSPPLHHHLPQHVSDGHFVTVYPPPPPAPPLPAATPPDPILTMSLKTLFQTDRRMYEEVIRMKQFLMAGETAHVIDPAWNDLGNYLVQFDQFNRPMGWFRNWLIPDDSSVDGPLEGPKETELGLPVNILDGFGRSTSNSYDATSAPMTTYEYRWSTSTTETHASVGGSGSSSGSGAGAGSQCSF